jgi:GNAT superfamily N-acetyltransferase
MMIEPPSEPLVRAVLEIYYRVLISVELLPVKGISGTVHCGGVGDLRIGMKRGPIKLGEYRGRRNAVETVAMVEYPKFHIIRRCRPVPLSSRKTYKASGRMSFRQEVPYRRPLTLSMNIRLAQPSETDALVEFNQAMALETEGKHLNAEILLSGVRAVFNDPHKGFYVVAESGRRIVGGLMVTYEWSDWRNAWFWWIQSVYIRPEARGQRIYSSLYEFVKQKAAAAGNVCGFRLYVETENAHAQGVYGSVGMRRSNYLMFEEQA